MKKQNLAKSTALVSIILVFGYLLSFVKEAVIANFYGVSAAVDAYTIAITIPVTLFALVSVSIQSIVIPLYSNSLYNEGRETADKNVSNLLSVVCILAVIFVVLCEMFSGAIIYVFAPGFDTETHELASFLLRLTAPTIPFSVIDKVYIGLLNVHKKYVWPSLSVYFLNVVLIITIVLLHSQLGIIAACVGHILGGLCQVAFLLAVSRSVYRYKLVLSIKDVFIRKALKQTVPIVWSISIAEINTIVNRMVASFLFVGSVSALGYASKVNTVMLQFFTHAIATIVYPLYAESSAKKDMKQLNSRVNFTLSVYAFFLVPLMIGVFCLKGELIDIAFARGAFNKEAVDVTKSLLGFYSIGLFFMALRETITKVFYSLQDTRTPAVNATLGVCINIVLNITLPLFLGVNGLALATSISAMFISIRLIIQLIKKSNEIDITSFIKSIPSILSSAAVMGVVIYIQRVLRPIDNSLLQLLASAIYGAIIYIMLSFILKSHALNSVYSMIFHRQLFRKK